MASAAELVLPLPADALIEVAARFGTPLYLYDGDAVLRRIREIRERVAHSRLRIYYSGKANAVLAIASLMREAGLGLDACSPGDLVLARRAGFQGSSVSYTGFGATDDELVAAARLGATVVLDKADEVGRVAATGAVERVGLRVNPGITAGFHEHVMAGGPASKFGMPVDEVADVRAAARAAGLHVEGLHAHLGSDILDAGVHVELLERFAAIAREWGDLSWLNLGGGFGTPWTAEDAPYDWNRLGAAAERTFAAPGLEALELRIEPGGHLLMEAGVLIARVIAVHAASAERPPTVVVDASTNDLIGALLFDVARPHTLVPERPGAERGVWRVVGNLMQAGDILLARARLAGPQAGDLLALGNAGAYAASRASAFNERPGAAEALVRDGAVRLIRRRETLDELFVRDLPA